LNNNYTDRNIFIFLLILYSIQLSYFFYYFFVYGIFIHYGYTISDLTSVLFLLSIFFTHIMILIYLILIIYGYRQRSSWMRKFTMFFIIWSILWCLWGIIIGNNIIIHSILIVFYSFALFYLTTEGFKKYFYKICCYGKYVLYSRYVKLKSGLSLPIFFFSTHTPKSGIPTSLPDGYMINENPRSHMPYLKKIKYKNTINISKKDIKEEPEKRKVLYVVYTLKKGSKTGNWVVKNENKILSNHITKQDAIKKARALAIKQNYRVMVKNTDGHFSYGFKPRNKIV